MTNTPYEPEMALEPQEKAMRICPCCGAELSFDDNVYLKVGFGIVGCQFCIDCKMAEDALD